MPFPATKSHLFGNRYDILSVMRKKVFIALRMAGIAGQEKLSGIFRFLSEKHDWDLTLVRTAAEFTPTRMRTALKEGYDGFIVSIPDTEKTAALLATTEIPTIVMDIHSPVLGKRAGNIVFIRNSSAEIGRTAANHLLAIGTCRSYAFVHNPSVLQWSIDRFRAFRETLRDNGFWCHELKTPEGLQKLERPVGVFAANDDCGYDVIEFCHAHRLRVPEDVAVLGINNDTLICENCHPKLSSIQPDFEQEGFLAAETLSQMMRNPQLATPNSQPATRNSQPATRNSQLATPNSQPATRNSQLATPNSQLATLLVGVKQVVRRESTAELSQSGKLVQKALSYINKNALRGISVEDVARHLKVSRRLADLRFRELQRTSIGQEIARIRLAEVQRLLRSTKEPIDSIAAKCGYENPNYLKNLFRKRFFMSMREFRKLS